jgi:general L-amino acid transport system permease protein
VSERFPDQVELADLEDRAVVETAPAAVPTTPGEWVRANLFSGPVNSVVTVAVAALAGWLAWGLLHWVFVTADWRVFKVNLASYMLGRFPRAEVWRVWASLYFVVTLAGLSWGASGKRLDWRPARAVGRAVGAVVGVLLLLWLLESTGIWVLIGVATALFAAGTAVGRWAGRRLRRPLLVAWIAAFPVVVMVLQVAGGVKPALWGGFLLNVLVAWVAIFASFPIGVLLAVGRRSSLQAISKASVAFIELIRGVPLFTLLLFGFYVVTLILPPGLGVPTLIRLMIMFTVFSAAYVAEIVRGGLQGVPEGQYEAARALGLPARKMFRLVILPQALRSTIPAMIGHFISLFKDTSLLAIVAGFVDLLRSARRAPAGLEFIGDLKEALLPAAVIFWIVAFSMSRWSQRLERRVGLGER